MHFVAGGHAERTDLAGRAFDGNQAHALRERQGAGGHLRTDGEGERTRLCGIEGDAQFSRIRIKAPERDDGSFRLVRAVVLGRPIRDVGDGGPRRHVENEFAKFALRGADGNFMHAFDDTGGGDVQLRNFRVEYGLFTFHIAA